MPLVLAFLGTYLLLFTVTAFVSDPRWVAEIFRPPDIEAALFFAFIILTDPPTSPAKYPDQIVCGILVAVVGYAFFESAGVVYYLLAGVLAGNVWEAWRRTTLRTGYTFPRGIGAFLREIGPWPRAQSFERKPTMSPPQAPPPAARPTGRRRTFTIFFLVLLLAGAAVFASWLHVRQFQSTDDAFVDIHLDPIGPRGSTGRS
jgi:hypothetical protein